LPIIFNTDHFSLHDKDPGQIYISNPAVTQPET